jgi:hypothetical protein
MAGRAQCLPTYQCAELLPANLPDATRKSDTAEGIGMT